MKPGEVFVIFVIYRTNLLFSKNQNSTAPAGTAAGGFNFSRIIYDEGEPIGRGKTQFQYNLPRGRPGREALDAGCA
jgi:hypothetical protein